MILLQQPKLSAPGECSYLPEEISRNYFFHAKWVEENELDELLVAGWRRFATYYFRPECVGCYKCQPIRLPVNDVVLSKSQRKIYRKNNDVRVVFKPKTYSEQIYKLYLKHSERFNQTSTEDDFIQVHYTDSCRSFQSEYYIEDTCVAVGFLDQSSDGLSSSYFFYDTDYKYRSLGFFSIMKEIEECKRLGLPFYYLGYYIEENHFMSYKNSFYPHQIMDWKTGEWMDIHKNNVFL